MKVFDIAFKDMTQSFRSLFAVMFMFVIQHISVLPGYLSNNSGEELLCSFCVYVSVCVVDYVFHVVFSCFGVCSVYI